MNTVLTVVLILLLVCTIIIVRSTLKTLEYLIERINHLERRTTDLQQTVSSNKGHEIDKKVHILEKELTTGYKRIKALEDLATNLRDFYICHSITPVELDKIKNTPHVSKY